MIHASDRKALGAGVKGRVEGYRKCIFLAFVNIRATEPVMFFLESRNVDAKCSRQPAKCAARQDWDPSLKTLCRLVPVVDMKPEFWGVKAQTSGSPHARF